MFSVVIHFTDNTSGQRRRPWQHLSKFYDFRDFLDFNVDMWYSLQPRFGPLNMWAQNFMSLGGYLWYIPYVRFNFWRVQWLESTFWEHFQSQVFNSKSWYTLHTSNGSLTAKYISLVMVAVLDGNYDIWTSFWEEKIDPRCKWRVRYDHLRFEEFNI